MFHFDFDLKTKIAENKGIFLCLFVKDEAINKNDFDFFIPEKNQGISKSLTSPRNRLFKWNLRHKIENKERNKKEINIDWLKKQRTKKKIMQRDVSLEQNPFERED